MWISVKDRLPNNKDWVLTYNSHLVDFGTYREKSRFDDTKMFMDAHWIEMKNITHWQPLPEPPTEER